VGSWWHGAVVLEDLWSLPYRPGSVTLLADPGTRWLHCADTDLIAMVIERTSGLPITEYLKSGIFRELGVLDTGFDVPHRSRARVAGGPRGVDDVLGHPSFYSTPRDYSSSSRLCCGGTSRCCPRRRPSCCAATRPPR
jgi:CubicO group peptidase (beta-lactamase class C family)